jgi:hypothetical protein
MNKFRKLQRRAGGSNSLLNVVLHDNPHLRRAILLARPLAIPRLPPRIVRVELQAAERLPPAMVTAFGRFLPHNGARG